MADKALEHIARLVAEGHLSTAELTDLLNKAVSKSALSAAASSSGKASNHPAETLSGHYRCLQCSEEGSSREINKHAKMAKHELALEARSLTIYCTECRDLVYDPTAEGVRAIAINASQPSLKKRKSNEANGDDSYLAENSSQRKCGQEGVRGLFNLGETCYMNAILQMMVHNQLLSSYFLGNGHPVHNCSDAPTADVKANGKADEDDDNESSDSKAEYQPCVGCAVSKVFGESRMSEKPEPMEAVNLLYASWKAIPVSHSWFTTKPPALTDITAYGREKPTGCTGILHDACRQTA